MSFPSINVASPCQEECEIMLLGDQNVGKTSLVDALTYDKFLDLNKPLIGLQNNVMSFFNASCNQNIRLKANFCDLIDK